MKTINKEIIKKSTVTVYVASDGTEFENAEECEKYEKSAEGVLYAKYAPKVVKTIDEETLFGTGNCDSNVEIVRIEKQEDADLILQILLLENPYYAKEENKERLSEKRQILEKAIGDYVVIGRGWEMDSFWIYGSRKSIIDDFNKNFEF